MFFSLFFPNPNLQLVYEDNKFGKLKVSETLIYTELIMNLNTRRLTLCVNKQHLDCFIVKIQIKIKKTARRLFSSTELQKKRILKGNKEKKTLETNSMFDTI